MSVFVEGLEERVLRLLGSDPEAMQDPFPLLSDLRESHPVYRVGSYVLVSRYADVNRILKEGTHFSNQTMEEGTARVLEARSTLEPDQVPMYNAFAAMERAMTFMADGQEHQRRRRTSSHLFTPTRIRRLEELTQSYTDEILDAMDGQERYNLEPACGQLPGWIVASLLGIAREDSGRLVAWGDAINLNLHRSTYIEPAYAAVESCYAYVKELVESHRSGRSPTELFAAILDAAESGHAERIGSMFIEMQVGGYETTRGLLGGGIVLLMENRDQWDRLVADPGLAGNANEELLRMVSPALWTARVPIAESEISGVAVSPTDTLLLMLGAANRDPRVFEDPDTLDLSRYNAKQHRAFGVGPHYCMGQALARLEGAVFFRSISSRFPDLELAGGSPRRIGNANNPKLESLEVRPGGRPAP